MLRRSVFVAAFVVDCFCRKPGLRTGSKLLLALLSFPPALAAGEGGELPSAWTIRFDGGTQSYRALELRGNFGIDENWHASGSLRHSKTEGSDSANQLRAGGGLYLLRELQARVALLLGREPHSVQFAGFLAGLDWTANPRADSEHRTLISVDFQALSYRQQGSQPDPSKRLGRSFLERSWSLALEQDLGADITVNGFVNGSRYLSAEGDRINTVTDRRRRFTLPGSGGGQLDGFSEYSFGAGFFLRMSDEWSLGFDYARSHAAFTGGNSDSFAPALGVEVDRGWTLGFHGSYLRQEPGDSALTAGLSLTHDW